MNGTLARLFPVGQTRPPRGKGQIMIYSFAIRQVREPRQRNCSASVRRSQRALRRQLNAQQASINMRESWDAQLDREAIQKISRVLRSQD